MKKQIAKSFYKLSVFFDCTYAEHLNKSKLYDGFQQELSEVTIEIIDIIEAFSQGKFIEYLPIKPDLWGAINDALNFLVYNLVEEIKQLPDDHPIRRKFQIYETGSNSKEIPDHAVNNDSKNGFMDDFFDDLDDFDDYTNIDSRLEKDIISQNSDSYGALSVRDVTATFTILKRKISLVNLTTTIHKIFGKSLGKLFFNFSIFFDKNYLNYLGKSQKYDHILENLSRQIITIVDIVENWCRGDLTERIEINYIHDFYYIANTLNGFIDMLTKELEKLPENSSFKQKFKLSQ